MSSKADGRDTAFLNLFRGIAALWVLIAHCALWSETLFDRLGWFDPKKAVDLFMVLSGFLMFFTIDKSSCRENPMEWRTWHRFYARRFFRISPLYYVALTAVIVIWPLYSTGITALQNRFPDFWYQADFYPYLAKNQDFGFASIILHITYLFGLFPTYSFSTMLPDWSLSLEMQFYLSFPVIYIACRKYPMWWIAVAVAFLCLALTRGIMWASLHGYFPVWEEPSLLVFKLPVFLAGGLIYEASLGRRTTNLTAAAVVLGLGLISTRHTLFAFALIIGVLAYFATKGMPRPIQRLCHSRAVSFLSDTSYAVYLCHGFTIALIGPYFVRFAEQWLKSNVAVAAAFTCAVILITYPLAWLAFRFIEKPGIALGKRIIGSKEPIVAPMA